LGRWISRDPLEEESVNPYAFIDNDVINALDYLGLSRRDWDKFKNDPRAKGVLESGDANAIANAYKAWLGEKYHHPEITEIFKPTEFDLKKIENDFNAKYFGSELHILVGGGRLHLSCCDGVNKRYHHYSKVCFGAALELSASGGRVFNADGESCKNAPENLIGAELGLSVRPLLGLEGGVAFDMAGEAGASPSIGGGPGRGAAAGLKATVCYYRLTSSEKTKECCSLNKN